MNTRVKSVVLALAIAAAGAVLGAAAMDGGPRFTSEFGLENCRFVPNGQNTFFRLQPGRFWRYEGMEDGELVELEITVLNEVQVITFELDGEMLTARTRVVEEREWIGGDLVEVARNFFARCQETGNVFYFGEDVDFFENGVLVDHHGSWRAGVDGALPGLIMPSMVLLGSRYFQEIAPGVALDRARHAHTGCTIETPAGTFEGCLVVVETTPLEPGVENTKTYAPGVGLIKSDELELVEWR